MRSPLDLPELCNKLRPLLGRKIDDLFLEYAMADTQEKKQEIYQIVVALYSRYVDKKILDGSVLLHYPDEGILAGEYELGKIHYPNKPTQQFALRKRDWARHVCITGMSGSGKTTLAIRLIYNFLVKRNAFIVFDWKKSFRQLLSLSKHVIIFTVGKPKASNFFRLNINKPPKGVPPDEWITILADLICEVYGASFGVHKLLTQVMKRAYQEFGVYSGSENYPTWYQIRDRLEDMANNPSNRGRQSEWLISTLRIAHSLTFGEFGQTINDKSKYNLSVEELLESQVVFEMDSLGTMEKKMFASFILMYIYKSKKANTTKLNNPFQTSIVVDEAHNVFLKQRPNFIQESVTDMIYREIREYGISLVCLDQHASKLSDTVLGNSATNIAFQQILPADVDTISRLMFLYDDKILFTKLKVGQAAVKLTDRFYEPFLMNVEMINTGEQIPTDEELRSIVKNNYIFKKRLKLSQELMQTEKLAEELDKLENAYSKSNVKPDKEKLVEQIKNDMEGAGVEKEKPVMFNHLQKQVFDAIPEFIARYGSIKDCKAAFIDEGFKQTDISLAFKVFTETREGEKINRFLHLFKSYSKNKKINNIRALAFMQKIALTGESLPTSKLFKELSISARKGTEMKNSLIQCGLLKVREKKNNHGMVKILAFTNDGRNLTDKLGMA